ncbi:hypothetical protein ACWEQ8_11510 [Streptomyces noursei]
MQLQAWLVGSHLAAFRPAASATGTGIAATGGVASVGEWWDGAVDPAVRLLVGRP